jgi:parvulin-like peptidyl-prolyl isomerase
MKKRKTAIRGRPLAGIMILSIFLIAGLVGALFILRHKNPSTAAKASEQSAHSQSATPGLPPNTVAVVGGEQISAAEFSANVRIRNIQYLQQYTQMVLTFGDDPSIRQPYQNAIDNLGKDIQEYLIEDRLFRQEAARRGITVSQQEIVKFMQEQRGYYQDGTPTPTPQSTAESGRDTSALTVTPTSPGPPSATNTPFTLEAYNVLYQNFLSYYAHYQVFESDLLRMVESQLIHNKVQAAVLGDASAVPDEQEYIWARHIQVSSEKTAREIIKKLNQGADFADLAKEYSEDTGTNTKGGDLGWFSRDQADAEFAQAAFALKNINDFTQQPVKTSFGYHIIQLLGQEKRPFASDQDKFNYWLNLQKQTVKIIMASDEVLKTLMPTIYPLPSANGKAAETPTP